MELHICTALWEVRCCEPVLHPGSRLDATLTAWHEPELAGLVGRPGVPELPAIRWEHPPPADRSEWVLYADLHGPHPGGPVALEVLGAAEVRGHSGSLRLEPREVVVTDPDEVDEDLFGYLLRVRPLAPGALAAG